MRTLCLATAVAVMLATPAFAQDVPDASGDRSVTVSGGAEIVSQYRFRGIGLSDEKPALQGWAELEHESGAYAGAWASSTDGFGELGGSNLELDLSAGYRTEVADGITIDGGLLYYAYPGSTGGEFEFFEPYAKAGFAAGPAAITLGLAFAPAQDAIGGESNVYLSADAGVPLGDTPFALDAHIGRSEGDTTLTPGGGYTDWSLGASVSWDALTARIAYVGSDISEIDALAAGATRDIVDDAVVLSLAIGF
ncbi:TorF family putative porin [Pelagerythrobacter sp.]|uniref:TorF family putative porin n=1 Tax=Pelagerythrobacter sp. TaxID=2800702 RepID=UPI0035B43222